MEKQKASSHKDYLDLAKDLIKNYGSILDDLSSDTLDKFDKVLEIISLNIKLSNGQKNFDTNEFRIDKSTAFNFKMKYQTSGNLSANDMKDINLIYQKHRNISKMFLKSN